MRLLLVLLAACLLLSQTRAPYRQLRDADPKAGDGLVSYKSNGYPVELAIDSSRVLYIATTPVGTPPVVGSPCGVTVDTSGGTKYFPFQGNGAVWLSTEGLYVCVPDYVQNIHKWARVALQLQ